MNNRFKEVPMPKAVEKRRAHATDPKFEKMGGGGGRGGRAAAGGKVRLNADTVPTLKRLLSYFGKGYLGLFGLAILCMVVNALVTVKSATFIKTLIDDYIAPIALMENPVFDGLFKAIETMALIYVVGIIANFCNTVIMRNISQNIIRKIRNELFEHLQTLPVSYFDTHPYGDIMSRFTNDVDSMRQVISQSIPQVLSSLVSIVSVLAAMLKLSIPLTLLVFVFVFFTYNIAIFVGGKSAVNFKERQEALGEVNSYVEEMMNGQKVVKVFCHEEESGAEFAWINDNLRKKTFKANAYGNILGPLMNNLNNLQYVTVAFVGGWLAIQGYGGLSLGMLASFLTLSKNFSQPISMISQQINTVVMALAGASRVFKVLDEKPETDDGNITLVSCTKEAGKLKETDARTELWAWKVPEDDGFKLVELKGDVRFKDVDFGYVPEKQILYDINLYAKPGQKIAFVGSTGAGKTTITNLINRFYDVQDGTITYDGLDIKGIKKDDLRKSLGIVLQDVNLFTGTIKENILYGRPDATDEEVIAAAKMANAHSFIEKLEKGYDTPISGTGSQLSQGQCQLLSIARCAVADPPAMILDEATSSVDTRTEKLIQDGMDSLMAGRTTFVIAHRLSTVQNSNAIMVLENGRIIERGDHDELIDQQGRYYQLYTGNAAKA